MSQIINYKIGSPSSKPSPIFSRSNLRVMLWAGDCVHNETPDVQRLPGYDLYVCYGFTGLQENINVLPAGAYICLIDIHNKDQFMTFLNDFTGMCAEINSDYHGSTPNLSFDTYSLLLETGGIAYNTDGIQGGFNPEDEFQRFLRLFGPVLTKHLLECHKWTRDILKLAEWNKIPPSFVYTDNELRYGSYRHIWDEQNAFIARNSHMNTLLNTGYTDETLEDYWKTLPDSILTVYIRTLFQEHMTEKDIEHISSYYPRLKQFLWLHVISRAESSAIELNDLDEFVHQESYTVNDSIRALQTVLSLLEKAEQCKKIRMAPSIGYFVDTRYASLQRKFGLWFRNSF